MLDAAGLYQYQMKLETTVELYDYQNQIVIVQEYHKQIYVSAEC